MPQTQAASSAQLSIILEHTPDNSWHKPGDTITGRVHRTAAGVAPEARVTVSLHGRSKTKLQIRRGQNTHTYRSSFNTLSARAASQAQVLAAGAPLHIPSGSQGESWRFALTIPPLVHDVRDKWQRKYFSSPGGVHDEPFPPPGTFFWDGDNWFTGKKGHGFTEYYVQATIQLVHQHKGRTVRDEHVAIAPFPLRNVYPGLPISDFGMKSWMCQRTVTAYRLVPGAGDGDGKLSFGQKTRQMFGSSKVPRLTFALALTLPQFLQVGNGGIIPVNMKIEPVTMSGLTSEDIYDIPQDVVIRSFSLRVKSRTAIQAERHGLDRSSGEVKLLPAGAVGLLRQDLSISVTPVATSGSKPGGTGGEINLGETLGIRVPEKGLHEDLVAYNIVRSHELVWEVEGVVAGESFKLGSSQVVRVLPGPEMVGVPVPVPVPGPVVSQGQSDGGELPGYSDATASGSQVPEVPPEKEAPPAYKG
ncbi:uncharacterized protein BDV17DRAFT_217436 [Aspergillus undulatus]|uniref:uncharacterized protein n=1 Tax=Aspergillus undulatus TaxID=1810928 RepID=UPI003CCCF766